MSNERDVQRAQQAQAVLDSPAYLDAHAQIEDEVIRQWRDARSPDEREELHRFLLALGKVKAVLESTMRAGKVASAQIERQLTRAEQMQRGVRPRAA